MSAQPGEATAPSVSPDVRDVAAGGPPPLSPSEQALQQTAERFCMAFERASRRWERVVYPGIALVLVLAMLGFYHIQTLSTDMRMIAQRIDPNMDVHMQRLADSVETLTVRITEMSTTMNSMSQNVATMSKDMSAMNQQMVHLGRLQSIETQMHHINGNMSVMLGQMDSMRMNFTSMNRSISKPMGFVNSFMPW